MNAPHLPPRIGKLVGLGGSLREASLSRAALQAGMAMAETLGFGTETLDVRQLDLPMYVPDQPLEDYTADKHAALQRLVAAYRSADAMLWSSPTYHGSMSGVFKNALDFMQLLSRDERPYLQGCAVGLLSLSDSSPLGAMAACVQELRAWLAPTRICLDGADFSPGLLLSSPVAQRRLQRLLVELQTYCAGRVAHSQITRPR